MYHVYENDYEFPFHWDSLDDAMTFAQRCSTGRKHHWRNKYIVVDDTTGEVIIIFRCGFGLLK